MADSSRPLQVAVLGAGAVGGLVGALLSRHGDEVTFVATESSAPELTRNGITIESERYGSFTVPAVAVPELSETPDVCVIAVKATQLAAALDRLPPTTVGTALVVPFLNGVDHLATLRARYVRVVPATMRVASSRAEPNVIRHTSPFLKVELALAAGSPSAEQVAELARHLEWAGIDVDIRNDEASMMWGKLIFLAALALLTTTYGTDAGDVRTVHRAELIQVIEEVARVAIGSGATLSAEGALEFFDSVPPAMQSSMQHDAAAGRAIELDAIGGAVLRSAAHQGVSTPVTAALVEGLRNRFGAPGVNGS